MSGNTGVRVIAGLGHGTHAVVDAAAKPAVGERRVALSEVAQDPALENVDAGAALVSASATDFDYLFPQLPGNPDNLLPNGDAATIEATVTALNALGNAMIEQGAPDSRQTPIPPIFTYWGQFVDHDLTAATDNNDIFSIAGTPKPVPPDSVVGGLKNGRNPALNLDSVYGDGPFAPRVDGKIVVPYRDDDPAKLVVGRLAEFVPDRTKIVPPVNDLDRDLPRINGVAQIGDGRNDENLAVAQLHVAFLRFHNNAVDWVRANEPERRGIGDVFSRARDLTRWAYQWLCVHAYLSTVLSEGAVDQALASEDDLLGRRGRMTPYMPLEFSAAAFRFGHSMVRGAYDWNRNFGVEEQQAPVSTLQFFFQFTGTGGFGNGNPAGQLPDNWPAEWERFIESTPTTPIRSARPIDTFLAGPLADMTNQVEGLVPPPGPDLAVLLKHLARRNLLRGYLLSIPTGQAVAGALGIAPLTKEEMVGGLDAGVLKALEDGSFIERTPLWFYVLRESEVRNNGDSLGPVGSRIVAETIIGQLRHDPRSYLNQTAWTPADGVRLLNGNPITSIADFFDFAGVLP